MKTIKQIWKYLTVSILVLLMGMLWVTGCQLKEKGYRVTFNTCTNLKTTKIKDKTVLPGATVIKPNISVVDEEHSEYVVTGWFLDKEYTKEWNFDTDVVESDIVLYAKWEKQFFVRYFTSNAKEARLGEFVAEGTFAKTQDNLAEGYKILGYYADAGYSVPFDFEKPITADTDVYIRLSDSIHWSAQAIKNGFITVPSGGEGSTAGEITLIEEESETYARIDFGYSKLRDPRINSFNPLDMRHSQIMTITYRNLGNAQRLRLFWLVQYEDGSHSGPDGEEVLHSSATVDIKSGMSEDDEWQTLTIDMGKLTTINGESQWANGKILKVLRIDSEYCEGMDKEFVPNIIDIKEISFASGEEYEPKDTVQIIRDDVFDVINAANKQNVIAKGFIFPKDRERSTPKQGAVQYNLKDCVTYLFPYGTRRGLVSFDMSSLKIDMEKNQVLYLKYKNEGYADRMTLRYTTTAGEVAEKEVEIKSKMKVYSTLCVNMLKEEEWNGELDTLDLIYHKKGTNNVISLQSIYVASFVAADLPGINFIDPKCAGFKDNGTYKVLYDKKGEACYFEMLSEKVVLQKNVSIDTSIYDTLDFTYAIPAKGIEEIVISYQTNGKWYSETFEDIKRTSGIETLSIPLERRGNVTKLKIELNGQGKISIRSLLFKIYPEYALDFSTSTYVNTYFNSGWAVNYAVDYDESRGAAILTGEPTADARCMFYLGASGYRENICLDSKNQKIYVCYSNPGEVREASMTVYYVDSKNKTGSGIEGDDPTVTKTQFASRTVKLQGNMKKGEWAVAVFDFKGQNLFSANRNASMIAFAPGGDLYLRAIVLK